MKRLSFLIAMLLTILMMLAPAQAESLTDLLEGFGLTESDAEAFAGLVSQMGEMTNEEISMLLTEFLGEGTASSVKGELIEDYYAHPAGFTLRIPEGWTLLEDQLGVTVMLMGPINEMKFAPTISVLVLSQPREDFDTLTLEAWDAYYASSLTNYLSIALDDFTFLDVDAHEFVCAHGNDESSMLMQYQLYFNKEERAYIITLTTLAEEAAHADALDTYDAFLAEFEVFSGEGNG